MYGGYEAFQCHTARHLHNTLTVTNSHHCLCFHPFMNFLTFGSHEQSPQFAEPTSNQSFKALKCQRAQMSGTTSIPQEGNLPEGDSCRSSAVSCQPHPLGCSQTAPLPVLMYLILIKLVLRHNKCFLWYISNSIINSVFHYWYIILQLSASYLF